MNEFRLTSYMRHDNSTAAALIHESHWQDINSLAEGIDALMRASHSKLTQSCRLSFFAKKEEHEPEWTTAISGPTKKRYARTLLRRLKTRFARKGTIISIKNKKHSKSKPLWAMTLYWRLDNKALLYSEAETDSNSDSDNSSNADIKRAKPVNEHPCGVLNPGLQALTIIPAQGCIHVELPLTQSWRQLSAIVSAIYKQTEDCGLKPVTSDKTEPASRSAENLSVCLGGTSVKDSPFLKMPELLAGFLRYWQNYPSLSYFFSGTHIGPYSQYTRLDEIRYDGLYELEIALNKILLHTEDRVSPSNLQDLLAPLLVGWDGRAQTAEICIDRLFPYAGELPQKGIIEIRSFAPGADEHMILLQLLLIRVIVLRLKAHTFRKPLVRWGSKLQNEFMLPYYLFRDFKKVLNDLRAYGYNFNHNWFAKHFLNRFVKYGKVVLDDVELELSQALEPVNRPVPEYADEELLNLLHDNAADSCLERLQLKVTALNTDKHLITCNDVTLNLTEADENGVQLAAIRLPKNLSYNGHHNASNHNLTIELVDRQQQQSLGGFFYGAEQEDISRFGENFSLDALSAHVHKALFTPFAPHNGEVSIRPAFENPEYPNLLDLRHI